ncbi:MAG: helix-turn-helix transcriptional regulator [Acidobacteriia bacterium]|nr:helix-turn-helix transcriptional regulator [Terriglobia bacterium]
MKLKEILRARGLAQRDVAESIGLHPVRLCRIINGRFPARRKERQRLADYLGLPICKILPRRRDRWRRRRT